MAYDDTATGRLLWQVTTRWRTAVDRAIAPLGLTHAQYALLGSLYSLTRAGRQPSQRELADAAGLEPIYVSKLIRSLEAAGLVTREAHPADTRARQLGLTDQGTESFLAAVKIVHALQDELTAPIGGSGSERNRELIRTLRALLGGGQANEE
ncbi:MarR family transcriptional regulator [Hamadaea sp. NPDC050747]|uniref:MarR family winged helix-turn-helix transcriptional regulator n=1 Tax=Hamadaea sp. NPDC050747 TaxID=3155789 RepID=UPI0033DF3F3A